MSLKLNERYPGRFDNPSSDYPLGSFKNRTTPVAKDGSYLEKDWANDKEGFFQSLLSAAGVTPNGSVDKVGSSQFYNAMIQLAQSQTGVAFTTTGTASAFTITPLPAITTYTINQRFQVTFHVAGGATPTLNASAIGPKSLKQYNSTGSKIAAAISAGQTSDVFYDGADWVMLDQLPNTIGVTQAQFDNSLNLATTAFVQKVGLQYSNVLNLSSTATLTPATCAGALITGIGGTAFNITLPSAGAMPAGTSVTFWNFSATAMVIICAGSDLIYTPSQYSRFYLQIGEKVTLSSNGAIGWLAVNGINTNGITGSFKNLTASATGTSSAVTVNADELVVKSSGVGYMTLAGISVAPSFSTAGFNGLDVGAANSQAASTWYSVWVIWNGITTAGLLSLSATAPTMPTGFTHKARVGWVRTDATANKYPLSFTQTGRQVQYKLVSGGNLTIYPFAGSGTTGGTLAASAVGAFVPPTAGIAKISFGYSSGSVGTLYVCANANVTTGYQTMLGNFTQTSNAIGTAVPLDIVLESSNIYWSSNTASGYMIYRGWEDNI